VTLFTQDQSPLGNQSGDLFASYPGAEDMVTAGTNSFTKCEDAMSALLAKSSAVRAFLLVADETEAYTKVFIDEVPRTDQVDSDDWDHETYVAQFPCVIISAPTDGKWFSVEMDARDSSPLYKASFMFALRFEAFANESEDEQEQLRSFKNAVFDGIEDMLNRAVMEPGVFLPTSVEPLESCYRLDFRRRQDLGHIIGASFLFTAAVQ
jgi:hypothetical protein